MSILHLTNTYWAPSKCQIHYSKIPIMSKRRYRVLCYVVYSLVISGPILNPMTLKFICPRCLHWVSKLYVQLCTQDFHLNINWMSVCPILNLWTWIFGHSPLLVKKSKCNCLSDFSIWVNVTLTNTLFQGRNTETEIIHPFSQPISYLSPSPVDFMS